MQNKYLICHEEVKMPRTVITNPEAQIKAVKELQYRDGDIMICAYPKCGNNWVETLIRCLLRKDEDENIVARPSIIELQPQEFMTSMPSPRVYFTHLWPKRLPKEHVEKRGKMVFMLRNPKDVAVSAFYHFSGQAVLKYLTTWDEHFEAFLKGDVFSGGMFEYLNEWEKALKADIFDIKVFYYEDLIQKPVETLDGIAKHIGVTKTSEELADIIKECYISNIKSKLDKKKIPHMYRPGTNDHVLFRKGEIGDWKNHFTVSQAERFDKLIEEKLGNSMFKFTYQGFNAKL